MKVTTKIGLNLRSGWLLGPVLLLAGAMAGAQVADFQIVWIVIGDVEASGGEQPVRAGKHLFMASDLTDLALKQVTVTRVEAEPVVMELAVGDTFCLSSLKILASAPDKSQVKRAPLSVSVRQDHREALRLERRKDDICVHPTMAGEYPMRFTSLMPAPDNSNRGAQIFIRVHDAATTAPADAAQKSDSPAGS